jgi:hypothetical protein
MGLFGDLVGRVVMKYEADTKQARDAVRGLSAEQKKAAKEQAEALDKQTEKVKTWAGEWVKAAAIIGGTLIVAQNSIAKYRDETRLAAGAAGVDINRLSEAYDGLRTRTELMTLAQAGHQGAWKLTTGQIELVVDGMRALEAKGYDSQKVFERFTEILRKGKTEGIDEFGISLKDTGDKATDLRQLMRELGRQVVDVGGNFELAGDNIARSMVTAQDAIGDVRIAVGKLSQEAATAAGQLGRNLAFAVGGPLETAGNQELAVQQYQDAILARRFTRGRSLRSGDGVVGQLLQEGAYSTAGVSDAEIARALADAQAIDAFRRNLRRLRTVDELDKALAKLPSDWKSVDANLIDRVDRYRQEIARKTIDEMATGMKSALALASTKGGAKPTPRRTGGRGGMRGEAPTGGTFLDEAIGYGRDFYAFAMGEAERAGEASRGRLGLDMIETQSTGRGILSMLGDDETRAALADLQKTFADLAAAAPHGETWLATMFGPIDEIDAYDEAFSTLGATVQGVSNGMFKAWSENKSATMATLRELAAGEIALEGQKLWARGTSGILTGAFNLAIGNPAGASQIAAGSAMLAGAAAIGALARTIGGSSSTPSTSAPGGGRSAASGRGGGASGERGGDRTVIVMTSAVMEASERQRERQTYRALTRRGTVYLPPGGR